MKKRLLLFSAALALAGAVTLGAILGMAGTGKAASTNTCALVSGQPNCLTVSIFPAQLTRVTGQGLIIVKFINQGSATATKTKITVSNLPTNLTDVLVTPSALCPFSPGGSSFTCDFGNTPGFGNAKVFIRFKTPAAANTTISGIQATLTYAEGNSNTGTPGNDTFTADGNSIQVVDGGSQAGNCTQTTGTGLLTTSLNDQTTNVDSLSSLLDLPCTPISAGTLTNPGNLNCGAAKCNTSVSFAIVPTTGQVTLIIPVAPLANGTNASKFTLYWFTETGTTGIPLKLCSDTLALAPVGTPKPTPGTDTCIKSQTDLKIGNVKYIKDVLTVFGVSLIDSKWAG